MLKVLLVLTLVACAKSARILGVFPPPLYSHQSIFQPIWRELSLRGHEVVVITPFPLGDPTLTNLTEIDVSYDTKTDKSKLARDISAKEMTQLAKPLLTRLYDTQLSFPAVKELIANSSEHFDVVITEWLHEVMAAFSERFNCPLIGITSLGTTLPMHDTVGNPTHPVLTPDMNLPYLEDMSFWDRLYSTYYAIWLRLFHYNEAIPEQDLLVKKHFGNHMPYLGEMVKKISLLLLNVNPVLNKPRPNVPAVIELGGLHIKPAQPLPKDIEEFLNDAKNGSIYVSYGTTAKTSYFPKEQKQAILEALGELPYKVLWKYDDDQLTTIPKNVLIRSWFPQQDILAHPNIKAFITQAGLQSIEEAIYNNVPMVVSPIFGDQHLNARKVVKKEIAVPLPFKSSTKEDLKAAVTEAITNPKYLENIKYLSKIMKDQPQTPLERAMWWIEYIIRHKGAPHLRSPLADFPWYKYLMLDVIGFLLITPCVIVYVLIKLILTIFRLCRQATTDVKKKQ